ncbi:MAG TPA: hypothetical protein VEF76_03975 [Patescibacteria group bacterium]|nr:hypothetical protein [Patescibacteria group bacterium]
MKKYVLLTALAIVIAAPAYAQTANETAVKRTPTAVEKAAVEQGFVPNAPGPDLSSPPPMGDMSDAPVPTMSSTTTTTTAVRTGAPMLPADAPASAIAAANGKTVTSSPAVIHTQENGLPKGLVLNGPGTEEYKRKHRAKKKKKKAAVQQEAPAQSDVSAEPVSNSTAPIMPDANAVPPADIAPTPLPDPAPTAPTTPSQAPANDPTIAPVPSPEAMPSPSPDPLAPNTAPSDPFAPQQ